MNKREFLLLTGALLMAGQLMAWRPMGHVILKDKIVESLPAQNRFREAMEKYPDIAAWGSVGPDLGYNADQRGLGWFGWKRKMKNSMILAELAHYNLVGTFAENLAKAALESKDERFIAFAGGWITHIAGDFGCHDIYVKPEAGYYIASPSGHELHGELEKLADAYLIDKYKKDYGFLDEIIDPSDHWLHFFGFRGGDFREGKRKLEKEMIARFGINFECMFAQVFEETYGIDARFCIYKLCRSYDRAWGAGIGGLEAVGFAQIPISDALDTLAKHPNRKQRIDDALNKAIGLGKNLLIEADENNYQSFTDNWNLDVHDHTRTTYALLIQVKRGMLAQSKNNLYIQFKNKDQQLTKPYLVNSRYGPLGFTHYRWDSYYYHFYLGGADGDLEDNWLHDRITGVELTSKRRIKRPFFNGLRLESAQVIWQGKTFFQKDDFKMKSWDTILLDKVEMAETDKSRKKGCWKRWRDKRRRCE